MVPRPKHFHTCRYIYISPNIYFFCRYSIILKKILYIYVHIYRGEKNRENPSWKLLPFFAGLRAKYKDSRNFIIRSQVNHKVTRASNKGRRLKASPKNFCFSRERFQNNKIRVTSFCTRSEISLFKIATFLSLIYIAFWKKIFIHIKKNPLSVCLNFQISFE